MLWFDNQAEEAANFYVSVFKKNSKVKQITHYAGEEFPEKKGQVMTVSFELNGQEFTALNPESFRGSSSLPKPSRS
jgi:predicted 3-demethylubiquinone-9 3-methyltransferase (glyoxalase superfamily)